MLIPVPFVTFSIAHLNCSLRNGPSLFVLRWTSRIAHCANFDFGSPGGSMNCPSRIPTYWCAFLKCKWSSKVRVTSQFLFFSFIGLADPAMDTYPAEEHLTPNIVNTTKTAHVAISMVCTLSRVNVCFSYFLFKRKIVESTLKVHRIELVRKAEPTR